MKRFKITKNRFKKKTQNIFGLIITNNSLVKFYKTNPFYLFVCFNGFPSSGFKPTVISQFYSIKYLYAF